MRDVMKYFCIHVLILISVKDLSPPFITKGNIACVQSLEMTSILVVQ